MVHGDVTSGQARSIKPTFRDRFHDQNKYYLFLLKKVLYNSELIFK